MATALGYFTETGNGFEGTIATLTASAQVRIVENAGKEHDRQPDYRIFGGSGVEVGAIWTRTSNSTGAEVLSATIQNPAFGGSKIYANLVPTKNDPKKHVLLWNIN